MKRLGDLIALISKCQGIQAFPSNWTSGHRPKGTVILSSLSASYVEQSAG